MFLELSQLVKALETEFGVTAAAPMAMAAAPAAGAAAPAAESKRNQNSPLSSSPSAANKINVIKGHPRSHQPWFERIKGYG